MPEDVSINWRMALYSMGGAFLALLTETSNRALTFRLNGFDQLEFDIGFDAPGASLISPLARVVKVWRYADGWPAPTLAIPDFAGYVAPLGETGSARSLHVTCFSPLWRLKTRFVHSALSYNVGQGTILGNLLDYTNTRGETGILKAAVTAGAVRVRAYDFPMNIWTLYEEIINIGGGMDLRPRYRHVEGSASHVNLDIQSVRGTFKPSSRIEYRYGINNAPDMARNFSVEEQAFATSIEGVGEAIAGNDGPRTLRTDATELTNVGLYEGVQEFQGIEDVTVLGLLTDDRLKRMKKPQETPVPTLSAATGPWYRKDFEVGDVIPVAAKDARMTFVKNQRVHEAVVSLSENNAETVSVSLADDYNNLVPLG